MRQRGPRGEAAGASMATGRSRGSKGGAISSGGMQQREHAQGESDRERGGERARDGVGSGRGSATKRAVEGARKRRGSNIGSAQASRGELVRASCCLVSATRPSPAMTSMRPSSARATR